MQNVKQAFKTKLANTAARFKKDEAGNFAIMAAVSIAVLVAGLAVAVDASNGYHAKQRLQDTADAIALMAAKGKIETQVDLDAAAIKFLEAKYGTDGANVRLQNITRDGDLVTVSVTNKIPTYFTGIFRTSGMDIGATSQALYADAKIEISLVLDSTGSMYGAKMASLKVAASNLVGQLEAGTDDDKIKMSVVPFAQYVNVGPNNANANWVDLNSSGVAANNWNGCVGSRTGSLDQRVDVGGLAVPGANLACPTPISPLTNDLNVTRGAISGLNAQGWTYLPSGLMWGWRTLDSQAPFQDAAPKSDTKTDKIMIVMTDGANTRSKNGQFHEAWSQSDADDKAENICKRIKDENITIYTIAYEVNDTKTENLMRDCATKADNYFDAANASELKEAFDVIAASLTELRLTS